MSFSSGYGDEAVARVCEGAAPEGRYGMYWSEGPERVAKPPALTNAGKKLERGPEFKDIP
ncbi:MAG: hypothetical protein KTR25_06110 [Myxococcales bacterium]|nr:hypothetical protein [Myxococcales bacterium]